MSKFSPYLQAHRYAYEQAIRYLRKGWLGSVVTLLVIAIALALPFSLLLISRYANEVFAQWGHQAQIVLYLQPNVDTKTVQAMKSKLEHYRTIAAVKYISPEEGLQQLAQREGFKEVVEQLDNNPLPAVLEVEPKADLSAAQIDELTKQLRQLPLIDQNYVNTNSVKQLYSVLTTAKRFIFSLAILLGASVMLIVGNTLRLIILQRSEEIQVMRLVGASEQYTRRPYLYIGLLLGMLGGVAAWTVTFALFSYLNVPLQQLQGMNSLVTFSLRPGFGESVVFFIICMLLGWSGALVAAKKFCRVA